MTVIRPNGISGITSITSSGDAINFFKSDGTLGPVLGLNINATSGVSTFAALNVTGVLTYEDVTSVDSVGIITARSDLSIADKIIHTGDTNTAIRFPAADTITAETSGSERLRIDASGRVMIGNTVASSFTGNSSDNLVVGSGSGGEGITVYSATDNQGSITFADGTSGNAAYRGAVEYNHTADRLAFRTAGTGNRMIIDSSGRLLLGGTTTEGYSTSDDLTIATSGSTGMTIRSGTSNYGSIHFSDATSGTGEYAGVLEYAHATDHLAFYTASTQKMRIDSSGRLLLGTTTEGQSNADDLTVESSGHTGITIRSGTSSYGSLFFSDGTSGDDEFRGYVQYNHSDNRLSFGTNSSERMRIDSDGIVQLGNGGFGQTKVGGQSITGQDYSATLKIYDTRANMWGMQMRRDTGTGPNGIFVRAGNTSSNYSFYACGTNESDTHFVCRGDGQIGMGTNSPAQQSGRGLHIHNSGGQTRIKLTNNVTGATANDGFDIIQEHNNDVHILNHENGILKLGTNDAEKARITSSGDVGIGNDASFPIFTDDRSLLLGAGGGSVGLQLYSSTTGYGGLYFGDANSGSGRYRGYVEYKHNDDWLRFAVNGQERVRIDSSGRMGVGINSPGNKLHVADSTTTPILCQSTGQGTVYLRFQNTNNARGYVGYEGKRLAFYTDNGSDTGDTRVAFLDADGLKFFNDTAQANALDDYEEGTYTPILAASNSSLTGITYAIQSGFYRKVGRIVYISAYITWTSRSNTSSSGVQINLPFQSHNSTYYRGSMHLATNNVTYHDYGFDNSSNRNLGAFTGTHISANTSYMELSFVGKNNGSWSSDGIRVNGLGGSGGGVQVSGTYMT